MKEIDKQHRDIFKNLYGDLMEFADRISSVLGCPITIEDRNHRLLAYSMHDDTTDQARISTIIGRRVPEKVINSLWKDGIIPALLKENFPIKIGSIQEVGLGNRAAVSIRKNNEVLGFIWALEVNKPFTDEDLAFLLFSAKEAKNQLQQLQIKKKREEAGHQEFLWRLLTGHYQQESEMIENFSRFSIQLPSMFSILVFEFPSDITREVERHISYMLSTTQQFKSTLFTIDQNKLILLAGAKEEDKPLDFSDSIHAFLPFFIREMKRRFGVEGILGASGNQTVSLSEAMSSYQQALYTLKMKHAFPKETEEICHYEELGVLQALDLLISRPDPGFPPLMKLKKYDEKNQTDLLDTLTVYLDCDGNLNDASKILHIHVNTMNYRLKRIIEISSIRPKDPIQKMALYLHIKAAHYRQYLKESKGG
ncbi:helix-turn-helix domain-containing protein [Bacillus massiliglaciei]|uniref:PucR family transcriptional regulator n=1 Tax=Bacillus massiliglaciei TaxID=1816693 RepID=UPI001F18EDDE|nr:PucR family transcriptional regulator [Bacillus massiliglaciei]